ncbi:HAMP domain-containing histidine kinase [Polynucleobacter sp. 86C-FISCH]|uniref:sensor histidine kinase n=1 Tax=Polynucleobacter sp. 86C-FISCH TaxID=2689101 RepID=UPI001C0D800F|nr:HAMP domain-containing sensor histidine kinase [Polynucleobacter sp. 86C-FISCH]MBU3595147.1 HAMP domain-containing histidine kinase [Polynucleobacter sp. 86C-FISCH]
MNSYATLTFIYTLFTFISISILCLSFKKKMDESAIYFLISEICMGITSGTIFLININTLSASSPWTGIPILSALGAEAAILFSILSLAKNIQKKWFILVMLIIASITVFIEMMRADLEPRLVILMISICLTTLFSINYWVCRFQLPVALGQNQFMRWFTWFELGMVVYGAMRILGYFSPTPIRPWETPSAIALIAFSFYLVLGTFRYISYIGLRISWINPASPTQNPLNRPLVNAIEEKDQLLRGLIASNRVIGISALASSLAHQLSQPLTTIALRADTIRRDLTKSTDDKQFVSSLDEISEQSTKLALLVQNLRQLFGSRSYEFTSVNLQKITDEIIDIVEPSLQAKKIILNKEYIGNQEIYGDSIQIQQVLINILNNAIDELTENQPNHKIISIRLESNEKFAIITIADNGSGISSSALSTMFELYKTSKKSGLGVGLWLCKTIIERHHGFISASNDPHGGAIFKIEIPLYLGLNH